MQPQRRNEQLPAGGGEGVVGPGAAQFELLVVGGRVAERDRRRPDVAGALDGRDGGVAAGGQVEVRGDEPAAVLAQQDEWRPWRSYALLHLWTTLMPPAPDPSGAATARPDTEEK